MPTQSELKAYAQEHSWNRQMSESKGLDSFDNYIGPDRGDNVVVLGRNRDCDTLSISNFEVALERLGGESDTVTVERDGHWACGWIELLMVDPTDLKALETAYTISEDLKDYPVLDEDDFCAREYEERKEFAEDYATDLADALIFHLGLEPEVYSQDWRDLAFELNMECQRYYGDDSCINIYSIREPDADDIRVVIDCLEQMWHNCLEENEAFQYLCTALNVEVGA